MQKKINHSDLITQVKAKMMSSNIFSAASVLCGLMPSVIVVITLKLLMDNHLNTRKLIFNSIMMVLCLTLKSLFYGLSIWKAHNVAYRTLREIRTDMIEHMRKMPISFFQMRKTGDLANIINHDVEQVEVYLAHGLPEIMSATLVPSAIFLVVIIIDWRLGLAMISTLPIIFLMQKGVSKLWGKNMKHFSDSTRKMSENLMEYIATIPIIKAFSREEQKTQNVLDGIQEYLRWIKKTMLSISVPMGFVTTMLESGLIATVIVGSILLSKGEISVQKFILVLILGNVFSSSFAKLATFQHYGVMFNQAMNNISSVLDVAPPNSTNRLVSVNAGDIVLKDVSFSYDGKKENLSHVSLTFQEGSVNAIVGSSGSGKSTLANLIMGFWQPNSGEISIGGKDITEMTEQALSRIVSIVQQDVFLFNLSIAENIKIGKHSASMNEIMKAAQCAQIHDFIINLPQGYETVAGEAGVKFSGGEKQRISIARMILKNAPIIILDEATAAVDSNNENLIQRAISNLGENKTIITIAHRLNSIIGSDQIIVLDSGKVVGKGKHKELLESCPLYSKMLAEQNKVDSWQIKEEH